MTILNHPSALELSGNLTRFRISSAEAFTFVLKKGSEVLLSQVYNPGSTGIVEIDVREAVESKLSYLFQDASAIYEQVNLVGTFTATIDATVITFTAIRSGVDRFADSATNFLTANFLTWQPQVKHVTYYSPEFLTYYSPAGGIAKLVAHYSDDTTEVLTIGSLASGKAYTIPLQYASVNALLTKKLPSYYDVYVTNAGGDRLSYIQRFAASNIKSEDERWFLFENSLGGLDTIRAYGADGFTGEHTHNIADIDEVAEEYRVDTSRIYSKNTGYLDDYERRWLLDFFPSKKKYVYTQSAVRQIVVTESDVDYNSKDLPSSYSFKYRFSEAKPYLNLSRVDEIPDEITLYTPDVGSFTLPLRLNDLPHIELTEGALIPGQNPYSEHAGVFSVAELIAYLKSNEQLDVAFVKRSATGATIEGNGKVFGVDVDADGNLVFHGNIYATGSVSAQGVGTGGGGTSYNRLDTWDAYVPGTTDTWVLSALLGHDLHTRVTALEEDTPNVAWGVPTTDYVPLTVNAISRQLSIHGHGHTFASLASKPTTIAGYGITDSLIYEGDARLTNSRPASDVSAWAKAATKPAYSYTEVGAAAASHYHDDRYFQKGELFTKEGSGTEADPYRIRANFPFYGISSVAALGIGSGGGGGTSYNRLDTWDAYVPGTTDTWVLSALLGHDLHTRVTALEEDTPNVAWGVPTTDYVPLTVNAISRQLSIHGHGHTFASLASKPTTISGYGITDGLIYEGDARLTNSRPASDVSAWAKAATKPSYSYTEVGAAAASHTHGNITNDGKIGSTASLVIVTGTAGALTAKTAGTTAQYLRGDGSWATPPDTVYVHPTKTSRSAGGASHFITAFTSDTLGHVTGITTAAMAKADVESVLTGNSITSHYHDDRYFQKGELFTKEGSGTEADPYRIRANFPFYGLSSVSALGIGTGGGGTSYDRLDSWTGYDVDQAGWVLSAGLGHDTYTRVLALEASTPNVAWGVDGSGYTPLSVNGITRQLSTNGHTHTKSSITDFPSSWDWSAIDNKPPTYTPSAHTHDDRYYTETEIGNLFAGTTAITGYNKGNWDDVYTAFNALQVGGRNLFKGKGAEDIPLPAYNGVGSFIQFYGSITFDPADYVGEIFTVSFWAKSPNGQTMLKVYNTNGNPRYFRFSKTLDTSLNTEWKFYKYTFVNNDYGNSFTPNNKLEIYASDKTGVIVKKIKIEKGNTATDWTPAPEDVDASIATVQTNLTTHAALTNNPHGVTKAQVGLSNVENTALSTWAGSGNITALGTVVSGTWNANAIAVTKGGTGKTSVAANSMLYATAANTYGELDTTAFGRGLLNTASGSVVSGLNADLLDGQHLTGIYNTTASKGENLIYNGSGVLGNNYNFLAFTFDGSNANNSPGSFTRTGPSTTVFTNEYFAVNVNERYVVSIDAKSKLGTGTFYMMMAAYDVDKYDILASHHMYRAGTLTTLSQDLKPGDTVVYLTSAANWYNDGTAGISTHLRSFIFWNYTNSFGYTYPAETYSRNYYGNMWNPGGVNYTTNTISLISPWSGGTIAAGTSLSNGRSGGTFKYFILVGQTIPTVWTSYTGNFGGLDLSGNNADGKFPPGTSYARIGWLWNYNSASGEQAWITNLTVSQKFNNNGGIIYGNIEPWSNNTYSLGSSTKNWANIYATAFTESGIVLSSKYAAIAQTHYVGTTAIAANRTSAAQALTGITSIDGSAAKLTTPRALTIGATAKNFDGSAAVSWSLAEIGAASVAGSSTQDFATKNLTVAGTASVTGLLTVSGNITTANVDGAYMQIGAGRLVWDATNNAIKVIKSDGTAANFYATGSNTAFGIGTGGGGSSYNMVSDWSQYVAGSEQWVVSAQLINAIRTSVTGHIGDGTHASAGEKSNWNAAYSHSLVSGGVHMTTTDRNQLTTAYNHSQAAHDYAPSAHVGATGAAHGVASTSVAGFMSSTDKSKLDGIATSANNYVHPTTTGNKHVPSGGSSGQILRWSADGTAAWGADNNTIYTHPSFTAYASGLYKVTVNSNGHVTAATAVVKADITALGIPAQDTVYTHPNSGVTAGTYKSVTVNAAGHVTGGTNPTTIAGYGITDAMSTSHAANGITLTDRTNWGTAYTFTSEFATNYPDLVAIEAITGTSGFLKKTASNTWSLDTNTYSLSSHTHNYASTVKLGTVVYDAASNIVSLPAYPTTLPASDVSSWAKAATKPSYTTSEVTEGTNYYFTASRVLGVTLTAITPSNTSLAAGITISTAMNRIQGQINARALLAGTSTQDFSIKNLTVAGTASVAGLLTATGNIKTANVDGAYMQVGPIKILYDATNGAIRVEGNLYATGSNTAFGIGGGAGGGGLITNVYGSSGFGGSYSDVDLSSTFNAYAINSLYTALQGKQNTITGAVSTLVSSNLYANQALVSGATGKIQASGVTATELSYLSGASSNIQSQLNAKPSVNSCPTAFSWNAGSTSGPTATISGSNMTAISVAAIPAASGTASGIVTTGSQTFAGEKSFASSVWLAGTNALVLDGATQHIYSHEQGEAIVTYNNDTGVTTHHWKNIFEGLLEVKTGNLLSADIAAQPGGTIQFANGATANEVPAIIGKSSSASTGAGLTLSAATANTNAIGDMTFGVRQNNNTDYTDFTKDAFRWSRYATAIMSLTRGGKLTANEYAVSALAPAPASASAAGTTGEIRFTGVGIFICIATNTWRKATISTF